MVSGFGGEEEKKIYFGLDNGKGKVVGVCSWAMAVLCCPLKLDNPHFMSVVCHCHAVL